MAAARLGASLRHLGKWLGLLQADPESYLKSGTEVVASLSSGIASEEIEALIAQRNIARKAKNWAEADRIRAQLQEAKVVLEDTSKGTIWRRE